MLHKAKNIDYDEVPYCACLNSRKLARAVTSFFERKIKHAEINGNQFSLLAALNRMQPVTVNRLAGQLGMDRTTLSRNVNLLERDGLCDSQPGREDKRQREISLTKKGKESLEKAYPLWKEAQEEFYKIFDEIEWKKYVSKINENIEEF